MRNLMKYRSLLLSGFLCVLLCVATAGSALAQNARNGTSAASQLMIPVDARFLGGGGAAAQASGIEGVLWNPAGVDKGPGDVQLMFSRRQHIADIGINFGALGYRFGDLGAIAVHLRSIDVGEIERTTEFHMDGTGEMFSPTFFTLGATYSRQMTDRINFGVTTNIVYEGFSNVSSSSLAFDAGVQYEDFLNLSGLRIGVALRNIGTAMQYEGSALFRQAVDQDANRSSTNYQIATADADMPTIIDLAVAYSPVQNLDVSVTYNENTYAPSEVRGLAEYDFMGYVDARVGYTVSVSQQDRLENIYQGVALGGSINLQQAIGEQISLDYGYVPVDYFQANHMFTLRGSL